MKAVERAARAELRALPAEARSSALAKAVIDLARRLDAGPADTTAVLLVRELRQATAFLHRRQPEGDLSGEVESFLERIAAPDLGDAAD
ncbi:MAG TPA: hypothetical protein VGM21_04045 [Actinomycetota bacterium]